MVTVTRSQPVAASQPPSNCCAVKQHGPPKQQPLALLQPLQPPLFALIPALI